MRCPRSAPDVQARARGKPPASSERPGVDAGRRRRRRRRRRRDCVAPEEDAHSGPMGADGCPPLQPQRREPSRSISGHGSGPSSDSWTSLADLGRGVAAPSLFCTNMSTRSRLPDTYACSSSGLPSCVEV
ncbi:unnamed protein product [Prorocentrum cordatum]|uniref:Uncharacterized protein n=1 Tax=Prorocentrum cordatum TaxID=2364126 RepID=A0ABN9RPK0_9DINO|nr:unnamed protein product [Polarella glacialis]